MKARCKNWLASPSFTLEVGKEYDFECKVIYLPAEMSDCVLARGIRTRHLQYTVQVDVPDGKPEIVNFYDRQYCDTMAGRYLCFDKYFDEVFDRSGRVWHPDEWPCFGPQNMTPWVKEELAKTIEAVRGDKAKDPVVISTGMPKPMDYERWKQMMMGVPGKIKTTERPSEVYLCILLHDDGTFKQIVGCFYDYDRAVKYANGSASITIVKQSVL